MKKIVDLVSKSAYTDGYSYHENVLPKYHGRLKGYEVSVLVSPYSMDPNNNNSHYLNYREPYVDSRGIRIIPLKPSFPGSLPERFGFFSDVLKRLEEENPDIIFMHFCQSFALIDVVRYLKKHPNCRLYCDNHADYTNSGRGFFSKKIVHNVLYRGLLSLCDSFVERYWGVLPARVDFLVENYGIERAKCDVLVMGGDDDLVKKAKDESNKDIVLKRASLGEVKKLIVFGGKIDSDKTQVLELIKAVGNLKDEGVGLLLFGSVSPDLKDLFDSLVGGYANVSYIGWVRSEASYELFEVADLVCFPGRHSVFWEQAAAQGKPLLLKQWPSYEHIDRFGNVAYTEGDTAEEIEKSIRMVFSNGRMEQMKCAAESSARYFLYSAIAKRSLMLD